MIKNYFDLSSLPAKCSALLRKINEKHLNYVRSLKRYERRYNQNYSVEGQWQGVSKNFVDVQEK